ncbi:homocysteine S-methyltransferase family protein [Nocardioides xinjiangensis]|uniref:homocysteine S-methyltransferase family protein n=1 Tax=Nocardioides xinjiangensis TaxID=2817376 RepID=UPI001B30FE71|nr:homocysteine S-methyltransferase family protein [Nocardioides sp. SYSU D00514]
MTDLLADRSWVTDGGLETDLLFNKGIGLPDFAAFPLVSDAGGVEVLSAYYADYAAVARAAGAGLMLETPTWRANPDWAAGLGYDATRLRAVNHRAVDLLRSIAADLDVPATLISGVVGPRGDGYVAAGADADEAAEYHSPQVHTFAAAGVDVVHAMTMSEPAEALGVVRAPRAAGMAVAISFTVETDGRLPDGTTLRDAVLAVDAAEAPDWYGVNCAHPLHVSPALALPGPHQHDDASWAARIASFRPNASTLSHAELDEMSELDTGDLALLTRSTNQLRGHLPALRIVGGCCGTDASHVAALWGTPHNAH